jgi:hypothetical protein
MAAAAAAALGLAQAEAGRELAWRVRMLTCGARGWARGWAESGQVVRHAKRRCTAPPGMAGALAAAGAHLLLQQPQAVALVADRLLHRPQPLRADRHHLRAARCSGGGGSRPDAGAAVAGGGRGHG